MIRIVFLIASLKRGGAEKQLTLLVRGLDHSKFHCSVVTMYDGGELAHELHGLENVEVLSISKGGRSDSVRALAQLGRLVRKLKPDIIHGYLDSSNVLALVVGKPLRAKVVWGVRSSSLDSVRLDFASRCYRRLGARLSAYVDLIIANSQAGRTYATSVGYPPDRVINIPNGFEVDRFAPDDAARQRARDTWGVASDDIVVGLVARLDPIKDHPTFLRAAALLLQRMPDVKFVCVGGGVTSQYGQELKQLARDLSIEDQVIWVGETTDMPAAYNALDVASLVSTSEGFANAVGEAMACGIPCVVTAVGDSAEIVGTTGRVIPPGDPSALCLAWLEVLSLPSEERLKLGSQARSRIVSEYSVPSLVNRTSAALYSLLGIPVSNSPTKEIQEQVFMGGRIE